MIEKEMSDAQNAYDHMLSTLALYAVAWSTWDEAYDFMKVKSEKFIKTNFVPATYTTSNINFFMFYDENGKFYYGKEFDLISNQFISIPYDLINYLEKHKEFLTHSSLTNTKTGLLSIPEGLVMMCSMPVIKSNGLGPIRGSLLMGYYLSDKHINNLSDTVNLQLKLYRIPLSPHDLLAIEAYDNLLLNQKIYVIPINDHITYGYHLLFDIDHHAVALMQMEIQRTVYLQSLSVEKHYTFFFRFYSNDPINTDLVFIENIFS